MKKSITEIGRSSRIGITNHNFVIHITFSRRKKMTKPKILVTSAAGRTGAPAVLQLLEKGFPVRAFVRRRDARSAALEKSGAEIFVGDLFDLSDLRRALNGVQRAFHCPPVAPQSPPRNDAFRPRSRRSKAGSRSADESVESPSIPPKRRDPRTLDGKQHLSMDADGRCHPRQPWSLCLYVFVESACDRAPWHARWFMG
jgi:hypothetical protein